MRTKKFMLTALMMVIAVGVSAQSVDMGTLSTPKSKRGDRPETGYVGTVELGGIESFKYGFETIAFEIATTHGYAVSPFFTIGAGVAIDYTVEESLSIPVFLNMRTYFIRYGKVRPFIDLRAGYQFPLSSRTHNDESESYDAYGERYYYYRYYSDTTDKGIYLNLSLGIRIFKRIDISAGVGYQTITYYKEEQIYNRHYPEGNRDFSEGGNGWIMPFGVRLGYRF